MAFITLTGTLRDPTSELAVGDQIRFTHKSTTGETVEGAVSLLTIDPSGTYSKDLQYGLVLVEYKDVRTSQFKNLGVATVNDSNPATSIPELLNALVPVSSAELIEFQAILADAVTARNEAEAFANSIDLINDLSQAYIFDTVAEYKASTIVFPVGKTVHLNDRGADFTVISGVTGDGYGTIPSTSINQSIVIVESATGYHSRKMGAALDGVTDDYGALQALIDISYGTKANFDAGKSRITQSLTVTSTPFNISGVEGVQARTSMFDSVVPTAVIISDVGSGSTAIDIRTASTSGCRLAFIGILGAGDTDGQRGIYLDRFFEFSLEGVSVRNTQNCIDIGTEFSAGGNNDGFYSVIRDVEVRSCTTGIRSDVILNGTSFERVKVGIATQYGVSLVDTDITGTNFTDCYFEGCSGLAIRVVDSKMLEITGCWFEQNATDITIENNEGLIDIHDNRFQSVEFLWMNIDCSNKQSIFKLRDNSIQVRTTLEQRLVFQPAGTPDESGVIIIEDNSIFENVIVRPASIEPWFLFRGTEGLVRDYKITGNRYDSIDSLTYFSPSKYFTGNSFKDVLNRGKVEDNDITDSTFNIVYYNKQFKGTFSQGQNIRFSTGASGLVSGVATDVFTINRTDRAGLTDGGSFTCKLYALVNHGTSTTGGASSAKAYLGTFTGVSSQDGTTTLSAVAEDSSVQVDVATSALRGIGAIVVTLIDTSTFVTTVQFNITLTGSAISTAEVQVSGELFYNSYLDAPIMTSS